MAFLFLHLCPAFLSFPSSSLFLSFFSPSFPPSLPSPVLLPSLSLLITWVFFGLLPQHQLELKRTHPVQKITVQLGHFHLFMLPSWLGKELKLASPMVDCRLHRWFSGEESAYQCRRHSLTPGLERSPREGNSSPPQYSCLGNAMDRRAW